MRIWTVVQTPSPFQEGDRDSIRSPDVLRLLHADRTSCLAERPLEVVGGANRDQSSHAAANDRFERNRRLLGADHPDTLNAAHRFAELLRQKGEVRAATELDNDTLARRRRIVGSDDAETLLSAAALAQDLRLEGRHAAAMELANDTFSRLRRLLGDDHVDTLRAADLLAGDLERLGHHRASRALAQDTHARRCRLVDAHADPVGENQRYLRRRRRALWLAAIYGALCALTFVFGMSLAAAGRSSPEFYGNLGRTIIFGLMAFGLASNCRDALRRHAWMQTPRPRPPLAVSSASEVTCLLAREGDARQPVLYLRSFAVDSVMSRLESHTAMDLSSLPATEEEQLVHALSLVGPVVAIGNPEDRTLPLGAHRFYVGNNGDWRRIVVNLMRTARLTIVVPGTAVGMDNGLRWEIEQARRTVEPHSLILFFIDPDIYRDFRRSSHEIFPSLPDSSPQSYRVVRFGSDWTPIPVDLGNWKGTLSKKLESALAPAFDATGSHWRRGVSRRVLTCPCTPRKK